jgi:hypothetical protein
MRDQPSLFERWALALFLAWAIALCASTLPGCAPSCEPSENIVCRKDQRKHCREVDVITVTPQYTWKDRVIRCDCVPVELEEKR